MTGLEELDETDIEEAIRLELAALDNLDLKNLETFSDAKYESSQTDLSDTETKLSSEEKYGLPPDSVETFIRLLQSKNDKLQEELAEAEDAVRSPSQHKNITAVVENENEEDDMKITPEVKEKVLHEIEELDEDDIVTDKKDADGENISSLEKIALRSLKELKLKQDERSDQLNNLFNEIKEDEIVRHEKEEKIREENKQKASKEHQMKMNENQSLKMKIEEEAKRQQQKLQDLQKQFELEMNDLEKRRKEEKLALEKMKSEERRKHETQKELACITIQKNFRMYRVQSKYDKKLKMKREERHKRRQEELDALERKEKRLMEEAVQKAKEEEMRRLKEIENEKKRKEEEEKKRLEDERRRVEEEEIRRKLEKEQEEERKMKLEMQRRRQEEERLERERLEKEEQERKMAEERKRREEEERRRIEEQRKLEEGKRLEEQRKLQQKKLQEQRELEQRRLEEQKKLEELERMKIQVEERKQNGMKEITKQNEDCLEAKEGQGKEKKISKTLVEEDKSSEQAQMLQKKDVVGQEETNYSDLLRKSDNSESLNRAKESRTSDNVLISKEHKVNNTISTAKEKSIDVCDDSILEWESCRDEWLKRTVLWSTLSMDEKANVKSRSKPRRPLSASQKLPSVSEEELLKSQNKMISLDKIVCINVKGLPPRNLKIMSKCPNVKSVTVQNCSVLSAESFDNCNHLLELNLSDNSIQNISCQNLQSLESLDLRNNQLTSIHGLDGCHKLRSLYLDGNKITRTGTFPSNKVIHLSLQNNQLITTKGLSTWKYLQILDCSNNHLSQIQELDSCPLLRILKLRGNNLRKPPDLSNHVLLRELHLSENSISSLEGLSDQWLPLLQHLYVNNNSLSSVCPLRNFPMLETLDVKNNLVSDEENLLPGLTECHQLRSLSIHGNPVCEDSNVRFGIVKTLPKLKFLDGEKLESGMNKDNSTGKTIFYPICGAQIIAQDDLLERQKSEIENCQAESNDDNLVVRRLKLQSRHFQELQDLMIKHRLEHENVKKPEMNLGSQRDRASISSSLTQQNKESESEAVKSVSRAKDTSIHTRSPGVSVANLNKTAGNGLWKPKHHQAATLIQAKFRGYRMRRRYLEATQTAQYSNIDLETEDFNFDEEVDLNMFDMDEAALDSSWLPTNLPQTARNAIVHDESPSKQEQVNKQQVGSYNPPTEIEEDGKLPPSHEDSDRPFPRKHAWRSPDSPISSPNPRNVIPPIKAPSVLSEETSPPIETHRSHRTSELSSEWGFSKNSTAELMLKRANRMKYNALRKKEMTNPEKRFQLFKKADESNKARGVQAIQKRKEKPRVDYFSGRPDGDHQTTKKEEQESQAKQEMTFSWVYDQAVLHKDQGEEILKDTRQYYCESKSNKNRPDRSSPGVSLPRMDPVILAGRNLPLVASPVSNPRTPSIYSGDVEIGSRRKYSWQQTKTHSNPDLTRVGLGKESRSGKSNSAEARIIKERNHIL